MLACGVCQSGLPGSQVTQEPRIADDQQDTELQALKHTLDVSPQVTKCGDEPITMNTQFRRTHMTYINSIYAKGLATLSLAKLLLDHKPEWVEGERALGQSTGSIFLKLIHGTGADLQRPLPVSCGIPLGQVKASPQVNGICSEGKNPESKTNNTFEFRTSRSTLRFPCFALKWGGQIILEEVNDEHPPNTRTLVLTRCSFSSQMNCFNMSNFSLEPFAAAWYFSKAPGGNVATNALLANFLAIALNHIRRSERSMSVFCIFMTRSFSSSVRSVT